MIAIQTRDVPLAEFSHRSDPATRLRGTFPIHRALGSESTAVVYFELAPGHRLGRHTDSAEEVLVILEGEVEAVVGDETARAGAGALVLVPAEVPHEVRNTGPSVARVAGVFSESAIVSVFDEEIAEVGARVLESPPRVPAG